jgi:hypothetical protein
MEEGEEKGKKEKLLGRGGFPRARLALLAVPWVAAVKCN